MSLSIWLSQWMSFINMTELMDEFYQYGQAGGQVSSIQPS